MQKENLIISQIARDKLSDIYRKKIEVQIALLESADMDYILRHLVDITPWLHIWFATTYLGLLK